MFDVLFYLLDEDLSYTSGDEAKYKSAMRSSLYKNLYNKKYKFDFGSPDDTRSFDEDNSYLDGNITRETKPYMPPTSFNPDAPNPFQGALREAPLG